MRFRLVTFALLLAAAPHAQAPPAPSGEGQANYVVGPEDVLAVTVFNEAQLSGRYRVENDGHFSYPFLGRIKAGGATSATPSVSRSASSVPPRGRSPCRP